MPRLTRLTSLAAVGLTVAGMMFPVAAAGEPPAASPAAKPAADILLFDGKTLANWKKTEFGAEGDIEVRDGQLIIGVGGPMSGVTWAGGELPRTNYEITLEAQRVDGSDFFVGLTFPVKNDPCSFIVGGWGGSLVGLSSIDGMDASENQTGSHQTFKDKTWYKIRLRVTDTEISAWIDDKLVLEQTLEDHRISIRIEVAPSKPLGFSTYATTAALKNIKLHKLTPEELKPAPADKKP